MPAGKDRIAHDVDDISSDKQLLGYAAAGQLAQLIRQQPSLTQGKIAQGAGFGANRQNAGAALAAALRKGLKAQHLKKLDEIIGALAPDLDGTGGLSSLALRLSGDPRHKIKSESLTAHVPPSWTKKILQNPASDETGVLIQASALLSAFLAADKMDTGASVAVVRERYRGEIDELVRRLILVSVAPPTSRNYDAQILLGSLASYAFDQIKDLLEQELRYSPLGFRVWRSITKLVKFSGESPYADALKAWVRELMRDAEELRKTSLYAGRSLDLECAITVPAAWSPPEDDWIGDVLRQRARNGEATIRERGMAAMGLWQRAISEGRPALESTREDLYGLISEFRNRDSQPAAGLRWVAATLQYVIDKKVAVFNAWTDISEEDKDWFRHVQEAADQLDNYDIPDHLRTGTKNLFRHMILQNAGVYRRQAIETVVTSGWNGPVARALCFLLRNEKEEVWLRVRAEFALGFLQKPDPAVRESLTQACLDAYRHLKLDELPAEKPARARITEMHSSLFAVGDCFGVAGAEEQAKRAREKLRPVLTGLAGTAEYADRDRALSLRRAARAAAYLLVIAAQPRVGSEKDLSEALLEKLSGHPDDVTANLSKWALRFRFAEDGKKVRPLLAAAECDGGAY